MYHGQDIDNRLRETTLRSSPFSHGGVLEPDGYPAPENRRAVLERAAGHLGVSPLNQRCLSEVEQFFLQVTTHHAVPKSRLRDSALVRADALWHPRGWEYHADGRSRALAHCLKNPGNAVCLWSAAALWGVHEFSHGADACQLSRSASRAPRNTLEARKIRTRDRTEPWWALFQGVRIGATPPMYTMAHCLRAAARGAHRWSVPNVPGLTGNMVRSVQVVDRFRRLTGVDADDVRTAAKGIVTARTADRVARLSDGGSDSVWETIVRLIAVPVAARYGIALTSQVRVGFDGRPVGADRRCRTILDLGSADLLVGVYYDGATHLERRSRDSDAEITALLTGSGWLVLRVSAGMVRDTDRFVAMLDRLFRDAARRAA